MAEVERDEGEGEAAFEHPLCLVIYMMKIINVNHRFPVSSFKNQKCSPYKQHSVYSID